ncbi:unnamed protein product [Lampetra fluviatilis]
MMADDSFHRGPLPPPAAMQHDSGSGLRGASFLLGVALACCCCCRCCSCSAVPGVVAGALQQQQQQGAATRTLRLDSFVGCAVREFTFVARKPGCRGVRVTTDACWGRCQTWEKPTLEPPHVEAHHRVCSYNETRAGSVRLPGCAPHVDPVFSFPVALSCVCKMCSTDDTECETY